MSKVFAGHNLLNSNKDALLANPTPPTADLNHQLATGASQRRASHPVTRVRVGV